MDFSAYDNLSIGIVALDSDMRVIYCNDTYSKFLNDSKEHIIGKDFRDYVPDSRFPEVLRTGEKHTGVWTPISDTVFFGNRIPIIENGKVTGAIGEIILANTEEVDRLMSRLDEVEEKLALLRENVRETQTGRKQSSLVYESESMDRILSTVLKVAPLDTTVLITGETGTGKEVLTEVIYQYSGRTDHPLVRVNCAALPSDLMESELFGYEKGAFTGALNEGKIGKFELASGGVLFLDEISSMPLPMQSKLLRVLQDKVVERIGGTVRKEVNVKIIAATNGDLEQMVQDNTFRSDLFYRLNIIRLRIPPLRERREDILPLCRHFLEHYYEKFGKEPCPLAPTAARQLQRYDWPGNVRELKNMMERLAIMVDNSVISTMDLNAYAGLNAGKEMRMTLNERLGEYERRLLLDTLKRCDNNKSIAAQKLGLNRATLYDKLRKYNIV